MSSAVARLAAKRIPADAKRRTADGHDGSVNANAHNCLR
jgi:hypothetical protein